MLLLLLLMLMTLQLFYYTASAAANTTADIATTDVDTAYAAAITATTNVAATFTVLF